MSADVVNTDEETFQRFLAAAESDTATVDPDEISLEIIRRILRAESADDVLEGQGATHARDVLNVPFTLLGVRFNRSTIKGEGPAFYALLEGVDENGEKMTITCGARNVLAQAFKLRDMDALPVNVELRESERETAAGYKVMWLEKASRSF